MTDRVTRAFEGLAGIVQATSAPMGVDNAGPIAYRLRYRSDRLDRATVRDRLRTLVAGVRGQACAVTGPRPGAEADTETHTETDTEAETEREAGPGATRDRVVGACRPPAGRGDDAAAVASVGAVVHWHPVGRVVDRVCQEEPGVAGYRCVWPGAEPARRVTGERGAVGVAGLEVPGPDGSDAAAGGVWSRYDDADRYRLSAPGPMVGWVRPGASGRMSIDEVCARIATRLPEDWGLVVEEQEGGGDRYGFRLAQGADEVTPG